MRSSYSTVGGNTNRLTLLYGVIIALIIGVILLLFRFNTHSVQKYDEISNLSAKKLSLLIDIRKNADYIQIETFKLTLDTGVTAMRNEEKKITKTQIQNDSLYDAFSKYIGSNKEQELFNQLITIRNENTESRNTLIQLNYQYGADLTAQLYYLKNVQQLKYDAYHNALTTLSNYLVADTNSKIKDIVKYIRDSKRAIYGTLFILLILLLVLGYIIAKTINKLKFQNEALDHSKEILEDQNKYTVSILESIPNAIVGVAEEGKIIIFNSQAEVLFGYSASEIIGKKLSELIPTPNKQQPQNIYQYFSAPGSGSVVNKTVILTAKNKNGEQFPAEFKLSIISYKQKNIALTSIKDITKRIEYYSMLEERNKDIIK